LDSPWRASSSKRISLAIPGIPFQWVEWMQEAVR
jgi:hypothetical protein